MVLELKKKKIRALSKKLFNKLRSYVDRYLGFHNKL